jgi:predicted nucleic acid-binding protein
MAIANLTAAAMIEGTGSADPDDDHVIACALAARADWIVSGDAHLLNLSIRLQIPILDVLEFGRVQESRRSRRRFQISTRWLSNAADTRH